MLPRLYAQLVIEVARSAPGGGKELANHFLELLKSRGHERLVPRILRELSRLEARERRRGEIVMRVAKKGDAARYAKQASAVRPARAGGEFREVVDKALVDGFSLEGADFRFDASARRTLITMFETLTA